MATAKKKVAAARTTTRKRATAKPQARKPRASKPKAKASATTGSAGYRKVADKLKLDKVTESARELANAQLGLYGKVYDELNVRVSKARKDAPRQWTELVKRGEQVRRDLEQAQKDLQKDLKARVDSIDVKGDIGQRIDQVRSAVAKIRAKVQKAA